MTEEIRWNKHNKPRIKLLLAMGIPMQFRYLNSWYPHAPSWYDIQPHHKNFELGCPGFVRIKPSD